VNALDCYFIPTYMLQPIRLVARGTGDDETTDGRRFTCVVAVGNTKGLVSRLIHISFAALDGTFPLLDSHYKRAC